MAGTADSSPYVRRDFKELFLRVKPQMEALDGFLREQVDCFEPEIRPMAAYCLDTAGKRLRPTMVFICGWQGEGVVSDAIVRVAGIVEMVHLATLVHDDIMDHADLRRNRRTVAREFGQDAAVLLGDALFSQALYVASQFPTTEVCRVVAAATRQVCSGEIMQTLRRRDLTLSLEGYRRIIGLKTAELFQASCFLGAKLSGKGDDFARAADRFGHHLGMAYQIYDDLADVLGEEGRIGKTLGTDLATGKLTLPLMLLLERLPSEERKVITNAMRDGGPLGLVADRRRMEEYGVTNRVVLAIEEELEAGARELSPFGAIPAVPYMVDLGELLRTQVAALATTSSVG